MTSDRQREANRRNSQHSTGPKTTAGKRASSRNSFKHGICVADLALDDDAETAAEIASRIDAYFDFYQPASPFERDALEEIALCKAAMARLSRIHNGVILNSRARVLATYKVAGPDGEGVPFFDLDRYPVEEHRKVANRHLGAAYERVHDILESVSRQEARLSTRLRRAEKRFEELRTVREAEEQELQNEAISPEPPAVATPAQSAPPPAPRPAAPPPVPEPAAAPAPARSERKHPAPEPGGAPERESA